MRAERVIWIGVVASLLLLAGCGQKGPLRQPNAPPPEASQTTAPVSGQSAMNPDGRSVTIDSL
jgi:predicted small lipoprotein YifL